jgi:hypothetical protein
MTPAVDLFLLFFVWEFPLLFFSIFFLQRNRSKTVNQRSHWVKVCICIDPIIQASSQWDRLLRLRFLVFSSVPPRKYQDSILYSATTTSFHIVSDSWYLIIKSIYHSTIYLETKLEIIHQMSFRHCGQTYLNAFNGLKTRPFQRDVLFLLSGKATCIQMRPIYDRRSNTCRPICLLAKKSAPKHQRVTAHCRYYKSASPVKDLVFIDQRCRKHSLILR